MLIKEARSLLKVHPDCTCQHGHELCAYEWGGWCSLEIEAQNGAARLQYSIDEYVDFNGLDYSDLEGRS